MKGLLKRIRKGYGKKLVRLHAWNAWIVAILALTGMVLALGFWRMALGEGRVWIKSLHTAVGVVSLIPVIYYLLLAGKHWKQLRGKPWQRFNVVLALTLLVGWLASGVLLWQFRAVGPAWSNAALIVHDLLTWIGLPYLIFHSLTRIKWLREEPHRRTVKAEPDAAEERHRGAGQPAEGMPVAAAAGPAGAAAGGKAYPASARTTAGDERPQPLYTRRAFIRGAIGAGLAVTVGPSFVKWLGGTLGLAGGGSGSYGETTDGYANRLVPAPEPLPASLPPSGGGARGQFRIYTVTPIPTFTNDNWSFTIDGLVERKQTWNWESFVALKRQVQVSDFHCVTGWSVYSNTWEGIPLKELLRNAGVQSKATTVKFYSGDGVYTDSLTLEQADMDDCLVAVMHDGKPISREAGGPVRLVVPRMYSYKSVKWLSRIELIEGEHIGYWEQRGYSTDAWV